MSEPTFNYTAVSAQGVRSTGQVTAATVADALRKLSVQGLTPLQVTAAKEPTALFSFQQGKITPEIIAQLTRELAVLVEARIPLAQGLAGIADTEKNLALQRMLRDVASSIEAGSPLTEALRPHERHFGQVYMETLRAAERSGDLVGVMRLLADLLYKIQETKQLLRRAMTYPIIVLCAITLAISVIVIFVIPKFAATFASQGVQMPVMTRVLQAVGDSVRENWLAYAIGFITVVVGSTLWLRTSKGRDAFEHAILKIPYINRIILAITASLCARDGDRAVIRPGHHRFHRDQWPSDGPPALCGRVQGDVRKTSWRRARRERDSFQQVPAQLCQAHPGRRQGQPGNVQVMRHRRVSLRA